jgi:outer membrane protein assembly factor BamD (BamD/ComL family)
LARECALLDRARKALAQGNLDDVEQSLESHARRYPSGLLLEEREALAIKTLVDRGRVDEARKRAARFKEPFPNSIFGPAVDETLGALR